jgi:hypothetical protein
MQSGTIQLWIETSVHVITATDGMALIVSYLAKTCSIQSVRIQLIHPVVPANLEKSGRKLAVKPYVSLTRMLMGKTLISANVELDSFGVLMVFAE